MDRSLRTLRPGRSWRFGDRWRLCERLSGANAGESIFGKRRIIGSTMEALGRYLTVMTLDAGRLRPVIDSVFAMADFRQAMERLVAGDMFGKIVIEINPTEK